MGKRIREWRPDRRRHRTRVKAPTTGWLRTELAQMLRIAPSTIGKYIKAGLLPGVEFRGTATRYQRVHLIRLLAIRHLRSIGVAERHRVKARMDRLSSEQLEAWVLSHAHSPAIVAALTVSHPSNATSTMDAAASLPATQATAASPGLRVVHSPNDAARLGGSGAAPDVRAVSSASDGSASAGQGAASLGSGASGASPNDSPTGLADAMLNAEIWQQVHVGAGVVVSWRTDADVTAKALVKRLLAAV